MINVLVFAYEFPPVQTTGSIRPLKFAKYLRNFGVNPIVITTDVESGKRAFTHARIDDSLLKELPKEIEIVRIPTKDFSAFYKSKLKNILHHYFSVSDHIKKQWGGNVNKKMADIVEKYKPQAIYATAPPFGTATIVSRLAKKYQLPLVLDMRDHWSLWGTGAYISKWHYYFTKRLEYKAFSAAKYVVSVTQQVVDDFINAHPKLDKSKFKVISNGFESKNMTAAAVLFSDNKEKLVIGYMGEFYYTPEAHATIFEKWYKKKWYRAFQYIPRIEDYKYRSPYYFFKVLQRLFTLYPALKDKVEFHYIGGHKDWLVDMLNEFDLIDNTVLHGRVSYKESLVLAKCFDFCLSTSVKVLGGEDYALASKTFDYLMLQKPILGFVAEGAQKTFLENCGIAFTFDPDETEASAKKLHTILTHDATSMSYNKAYLAHFDREKLAERLAMLFKEITELRRVISAE